MIRAADKSKTNKQHDLALICGDGFRLPQELQMFSQFKQPHDVFCVGRSLQAYIPFVGGRNSVVNYIWLDEQMYTYARDQIEDRIIRHSVFFEPQLQDAIDCLWTRLKGKELTFWDGSSAFFALMIAWILKYDKIMLCGVPLNAEPHWYDEWEMPGPSWTPETLRVWARFARRHKHMDKVRSTSGYTGYLFGTPTAGWIRTPDKRTKRGKGGRGPANKALGKASRHPAENRV